MPIQNNPSHLIYVEIDDAEGPPYLSSSFFVAIFDVPDAEKVSKYTAEMTAWLNKGRFARLLACKPRLGTSSPEATCIAAAYVAQNNGYLTVRNVAAESGLGPTLYACILEVASARRLKGVVPSLDPGKILAKPKQIWKRFNDDPQYQGKVLSVPIKGSHQEQWLNMAYSLAPGFSLLECTSKREAWKAYSSFWKKFPSNTEWREIVKKMAERSVDAHASGTHR